MRILLLTALLTGILTAYAQVDLTRHITLDVKEVTLDKLFEILETYHGVAIAFGIDNIPNTLKISLSVKNKTIFEILEMVCTQAGLSYDVIDRAVVFKYSKPNHPHKTAKVLPVNTDSSDISFTVKGDSGIDSPIANRVDSVKLSYKYTIPNGAEFRPPKRVRRPDITNLVIGPSLFSDGNKRSKIGCYGAGVFLSYAADYNNFHFVERNIAFQKYRVDWNHSMAIGGYIILSSRIYISLGGAYATKDFVLNYNYRVLDPDDPFPIPDQTKVKVRYLEIPLTLGYGILTRRKYSLCVAAGFYPSYLVEKDEHTTYLNSGNPSTTYFINANRSTIYSATLGFIAHYSIGNGCGIFIEPGYIYFIKAVNKEAMQSNSSLYRIKAGIQFSLFHKH
ncbi:outer membrane beta-barrel protein [Ohtaekwangia koreensis]|uniref:Outer membrane protein beta-barrel domain-containing protein n=1 Tax=Ohtaekwangia koreensis TaxID=688867 RepID=A0A1T5M9U7_9BACT|nr:outer membrane beta-barrel protein [Ohtaekwangia koreensis]SKC85007.1 Outer membrane protein beta-barrel domain-containing protein [Ohtaekwangia koreensis]